MQLNTENSGESLPVKNFFAENIVDQPVGFFGGVPVFEVLLALILAILSGCSTLSKQLKADPAPSSAFLLEAETGLIKPAAEHPFHVRMVSPEQTALREQSALYVAPVRIDYLRDLTDMERLSLNNYEREKDVATMAQYLRERFEDALRSDQSARFSPAPDEQHAGLVLELALVELKPTNVARNVLANGASFIVPGAGALSLGSSAAIAIEGRLRDVKTGRVYEVFADREKGQLAPLSIRDYSSYAHARKAIEDWAEQWVALQRVGGARVADSSPVTILPW